LEEGHDLGEFHAEKFAGLFQLGSIIGDVEGILYEFIRAFAFLSRRALHCENWQLSSHKLFLFQYWYRNKIPSRSGKICWISVCCTACPTFGCQKSIASMSNILGRKLISGNNLSNFLK
jgi:hypothetical protein